MKKIMLTAVVLALLAAGIGTSWAGGVSQATVLFLKIAPGARPSGMGEAFVGLVESGWTGFLRRETIDDDVCQVAASVPHVGFVL